MNTEFANDFLMPQFQGQPRSISVPPHPPVSVAVSAYRQAFGDRLGSLVPD
jgi:hypothetical protein